MQLRTFKTCFLLCAGLLISANATFAVSQQPAAQAKNIVLIHGAWADGSSWTKLIPVLQRRGYHVTAVQNPLTSLADDVAATKRVIDAQDGPVLLVAHSYGGVVMTEAGNDPKVAGLVYVAAFAPDSGESIADLGKGAAPAPGSGQVRPTSDGFLFLTPEGITDDFAQDLSRADKELLTATQVPAAASVFAAKVQTAAWHTKPVYYIVASKDRMIPPEAERVMAGRIRATTFFLPTSHVAMLAKPQQVADVIEAAAVTMSSR